MNYLKYFFNTLVFLPWHLSAQIDSVVFATGSNISDGIYINHEDLRWNRAIKKEQIISSEDKNQQEFIGKVLSHKKFSFEKNAAVHTIEPKNVFGFFQNNTFYINFNGDFYRVPVFGSISFLVANVKVLRNFYDPRFGYPVGTATNTELREFLIDYYEGTITDFSLKKAESLLSRDKELHAEFKKLSNRKKREQIHRFIRKYNERNPIYFLKPKMTNSD
jgi:hypothetical protein